MQPPAPGPQDLRLSRRLRPRSLESTGQLCPVRSQTLRVLPTSSSFPLSSRAAADSGRCQFSQGLSCNSAPGRTYAACIGLSGPEDTRSDSDLRQKSSLSAVVDSTQMYLKTNISKSMPKEFFKFLGSSKELRGEEGFFEAPTVGSTDTEPNKGKGVLGVPASRSDAIALLKWFSAITDKLDVDDSVGTTEKLVLIQTVYYICYREVVRQVSVQCFERGLVIWKIWQAYLSLIEKIREEGKRKMQRKVLKFEAKIHRLHLHYENELDEERARYKTLAEERDDLRAKLEKLESELAATAQDREREEGSLRSELEKLSLRAAEAEELNRRCEAFMAENVELRSGFTVLRRENGTLQSTVSALQTEKTAMLERKKKKMLDRIRIRRRQDFQFQASPETIECSAQCDSKALSSTESQTDPPLPPPKPLEPALTPAKTRKTRRNAAEGVRHVATGTEDLIDEELYGQAVMLLSIEGVNLNKTAPPEDTKHEDVVSDFKASPAAEVVVAGPEEKQSQKEQEEDASHPELIKVSENPAARKNQEMGSPPRVRSQKLDPVAEKPEQQVRRETFVQSDVGPVAESAEKMKVEPPVLSELEAGNGAEVEVKVETSEIPDEKKEHSQEIEPPPLPLTTGSRGESESKKEAEPAGPENKEEEAPLKLSDIRRSRDEVPPKVNKEPKKEPITEAKRAPADISGTKGPAAEPGKGNARKEAAPQASYNGGSSRDKIRAPSARKDNKANVADIAHSTGVPAVAAAAKLEEAPPIIIAAPPRSPAAKPPPNSAAAEEPAQKRGKSVLITV